ncbi:MAG: SDR family oxidoreductase [Eubacteriales bacterium]|nr:SDR family oxidoreductase [Eubacteriales bacterium]
MNKKIAFVTGASSGIGRAVAAVFAKNGYTVYGTSRRANYETVETDGAGYTMLPITLEDDGSVRDAVQYVIDRHGRIDVVVNAAGSGIAGAIEETSPAEARMQFDVCFFGIVSVLSHVLPHMREAKSGMVINIGSMAACFPIAFQGMYSAVKSALFMMTATLRMEVRPFGIKACVIEPGDTKTGFTKKRVFTQKSKNTAYRQPLERALYEMIRSELSAEGPEKCARLVLKAAGMKNPPARLSVGADNKILYALSRLTSWRFKERILGMMYLSKDPPKDAVWTYEKQFKEQ